MPSKAKASHLPKTTPTEPVVLKTFRVTGIALMPVKCALTVLADSPEAALKQAKRVFEESRHKQHYIIANSEDRSAVRQYDPAEARAI